MAAGGVGAGGRSPLARFAIRLAVTLGLLVVVGLRTDWVRIRAGLATVDLAPYAGAYLVLLLTALPLALRLRTLLGPTELHLGAGRLVAIQFLSQFHGMFLPTGLGIAIARWYHVTRNRDGRRVFALVTLIERGMLTTTLLLCCGVPLLLSSDERIAVLRGSALPVVALLLAGCALFFACLLHRRAYELVAGLLRRLEARLRPGVLQKLLRVHEDLGLFIENRRLVLQAFGHHLVFQALTFLRMYLVFVAAGVALPTITILWIAMLVLLLLTIPISVGGIGVRESAFAGLVALYGLAPEVGVLVGLLLSVHVLLNAGIGGVLSLIETRRGLSEA